MRKHFFVIIVALLVTATVCAAGCASNVTPSAVPSPTRSPTFVPKNISGYLNYTNRSAGIAIQYPPSWHLTEGGGAGATAFFNVSGVNMTFSIAVPASLSGQAVTLDGYSRELISALKPDQLHATQFEQYHARRLPCAETRLYLRYRRRSDARYGRANAGQQYRLLSVLRGVTRRVPQLRRDCTEHDAVVQYHQLNDNDVGPCVFTPPRTGDASHR